jgi:DNA transformation protein
MKDPTFLAFVLEQLESMTEVRSRAMFGGHGLYRGQAFFGIVYDGRLYFRVDDASREDYASRGMGPFAPGPDVTMRGYYEVPVDVLEDRSEIGRWAARALAAAPAKRASSTRRRRSARSGR